MSVLTVNSLQIQCENEMAALERLLRVVRFRGFSVINLTSALNTVADVLDVNLTVSSDRPLHLLERQLWKNAEIKNIRVCESELQRESQSEYHAGLREG